MGQHKKIMRHIVATLLVGTAHGFHIAAPSVMSPLHSRPSATMIDPSTLQQVAVYDSEMEERLQDMQSRLDSSDWNAAQNRDLVSKAQADLEIMNERQKAMKAEVASITEAKAEVEAQLETKTSEVAKFVENVEGELNTAREQVKALTAELSQVKAELEERTTEVATMNAHVEAHTGATVRLNAEIAKLKKELAAAKAAEA